MNLTTQIEMWTVSRMKKNRMKYRVQVGNSKNRQLNAKQIYAKYVRKNWRKLSELPWQMAPLSVELELQSGSRQDQTLQPAQLLYGCALKENTAGGSRRDRALFLFTDDQLGAENLLLIYSSAEAWKLISRNPIRIWHISRNRFAVSPGSSTSMLLCAVRHLMLSFVSFSDGSIHLCETREQFKEYLNQFSLALRLWHYFLGLTAQVIYQMETLTNEGVNQMVSTLNCEFEQLFKSSLQLDAATMRLVG